MAFTNSQQQLLGPMPSSTSFRTSPLANQALCKKHQLRMPRTRVIYGQICCGFFLGVLFVNIYYIYIIIYIYIHFMYIHTFLSARNQTTTRLHATSSRCQTSRWRSQWFPAWRWLSPAKILKNCSRPGKRLHNYGKSPFLMGKSTISTGPFSI